MSNLILLTNTEPIVGIDSSDTNLIYNNKNASHKDLLTEKTSISTGKISVDSRGHITGFSEFSMGTGSVSINIGTYASSVFTLDTDGYYIAPRISLVKFYLKSTAHLSADTEYHVTSTPTVFQGYSIADNTKCVINGYSMDYYDYRANSFMYFTSSGIWINTKQEIPGKNVTNLVFTGVVYA